MPVVKAMAILFLMENIHKDFVVENKDNKDGQWWDEARKVEGSLEPKGRARQWDG